MRVGSVQFVKGKWETGERTALERFGDQVTVKAMGEGFTWDTQDRARDIAAATTAWETAKQMIDACRGPFDSEEGRPYDMILLDEINIALRYDYLPLGAVGDFLGKRPEMLPVIVTSSDARRVGTTCVRTCNPRWSRDH